IGEALEPRLVGSWVGVGGGKGITRWPLLGSQPWAEGGGEFGPPGGEDPAQKGGEGQPGGGNQRVTPAGGGGADCQSELASSGATLDEQVATLSKAFEALTGAPLDAAVIDRFRGVAVPQLGLAVRIHSGKIQLVGAIAPGVAIAEIERLCTDAKVPVDPKLAK